MHPQVAINLAQWLSPEFAVKVSQWVLDWASGGKAKPTLPDHLRRYIVNQHKIPNTHFSMLNQMTLRLLAPMEVNGYTLPAKMMPDISLGKMFSQWCRENGYDPDDIEHFPTYQHEFIDHRPTVKARLYPNKLMTDFNTELQAWLSDGRSMAYFKAKDKASVLPLKAVIAALPSPSKEPIVWDGDL